MSEPDLLPRVADETTLEPSAARLGSARRGRRIQLVKPHLYGLVGIVSALLLWEGFCRFALEEAFGSSFSPTNTFYELGRMLADGTLMEHVWPSALRVALGLGVATAVGIPLGILLGCSSRVHHTTNTVFQFVRMTSPLAWMPLAIIIFGVGDKPVIFLIAIAAVWPIVINTAHGVRSVEPLWAQVVLMLGGNQWDVLRRAVIPAIVPDILTGLRISLGISWIILVPAEMLGVSSGLGYFILDSRDRFDYGQLMAVILVVGFLGFVSDYVIRMLHRRLSWKQESDFGIMS